MGVPARKLAPGIPAPGAASPSAKNSRTLCPRPARVSRDRRTARRRNAWPGTCARRSLCSREMTTDSLHPLAPPVARAHLPPRAPPLEFSQARGPLGSRAQAWAGGDGASGFRAPPTAALGGVQVLGEKRSAPPGDFSGGKQDGAQRRSGTRPGLKGLGR